MQVTEMSGGITTINEEEMFVSENGSQEQPLLDTVRGVEMPSHMWGVDPDSDSECESASAKLSRKPRKMEMCQYQLETAILVIMAMLLYVASISMSKGIIMS